MADEPERERLNQLSSYGNIGIEPIICQYIDRQRSTNGIFLGDNPLHHPTAILVIQITVIFFVGKITHHLLLKPFHPIQLISQIVAGIILGPLLLSRLHGGYEMMFPLMSRTTLTTFAEFGLIIYFFKIGVQINPKHIVNIGKQAKIIGAVGHVSAIVAGALVFILIGGVSSLKSEANGVRSLVIIDALTAFPATSSLLKEMNILNSEIGRIALSSSMVTDKCTWFFMIVVVTSIESLVQHSVRPILAMLATICYFGSLFFMLRPLVIWISHRNPKGKPMTQGHYMTIMFILLFLGLSAQVFGQPAFIVTFWFGLILPDGPPLGSALAEKIDIIGSTLIVPAFCTICGLSTIVPPLTSQTGCIQAVLLAGKIGKFAGTFFSTLHFRIEFWDSVVLSLIMCCKGLVDLTLYTYLFIRKDIGRLSYTMVICTMVGVTGFATTVIHYLYDPSKRYRNYIRKSIKDSQKDHEFKLLVCVHDEENVYPLVNLLQAFNPSKETPLSLFVLHLMELTGRAAPVLKKSDSSNQLHPHGDASSQHINNVFDQFQQHNKESITLQCFTAIAPFASIHDDICYVAIDTKSHIVIMPFHKRWTINGDVEDSNTSIRTINQKVLSKAPCSVGVLIDRSHLSGKLFFTYDKSFCEIAMIYLGGADDQEALTFSLQMAEHPNIRLTMFWVRVDMEQKQRSMKNPFIYLMEHIKYNPNLKGKVDFKEEIVEDGIGTIHVIRAMEEHFNLVIVGKHHAIDSPCTLGLTEWCELQELGLVGNLLASDFTFSVLVVQQQPLNIDF